VAQIDEGGSGRQVNVDINIIPFIDLMSVIIIFLLITAVWTQISMIQLGSSVYGKQNANTPPAPSTQQQVPLELYITSNGYIITLDKNRYTIAKKEDAYDKKTLFDQLRAFKQSNPDKKDAMVTIADDVIYNDMIEGMDVMMQSGFTEIAVSTGGS
tara:strand:- start:5455 stop:5922 length:468 start_codon:yes stop_codon:yes gene_type:complete